MSEERRTGIDRRAGFDRRTATRGGLLTHRRTIRGLEFLSAVSGLVAIAALVFALTLQGSAIRKSARDSCYLLRYVVLHATPAPRRRAALEWLDSRANVLHNCDAYADHQ